MLKMLGAVVTGLYAGEGIKTIVDAGTLSEAAGAAQSFIPRLSDIITQSDEMLMYLATNSTSMSVEDFDALDIAVASEVINQAFAINFDTELKNSWGGVVGTVQALMTAKATTP